MVFPVQLNYDVISNKSRMTPVMRTNMELLFARHGRKFEKYFLRVVSTGKSKAARSTIYVLNEGVINSAQCFSISKFKSAKTVWITPEGWKAATIACSMIFTGECRVMDNAMTFRFGVLDFNANAEELLGKWDPNMQVSFAHLNAYLSDETKSTLVNLSKEVVMGVHTSKVQDILVAQWDVHVINHKTPGFTATEAERALVQVYERLVAESAQLLRQSLTKPPSVARSRALVNDSLSHLDLKVALLDVEQITRIFSTLNGEEEAKEQGITTVYEVLYLLEAGRGCRLDYLVHFLGLVEGAAQCVWTGVRRGISLDLMLCYMLGFDATTPPSHTQSVPPIAARMAHFLANIANSNILTTSLEFRAVIFVFSKLRESVHCLSAFHREGSDAFPCFYARLTALPAVVAFSAFLQARTNHHQTTTRVLW